MGYWVYLAHCRDESLYSGSTTDLSRRIAEHNAKRGARYTASRLPVTLVRAWEVSTWSDALRLEAVLKKCTHQDKKKLVENSDGIYGLAARSGLEFNILCSRNPP
ncbi:MAG: GIY-YIG nuclease family protein [Desulfitobacteriaceae bacterium]